MNKVTLYIGTHNKTGLRYFGKTNRWFTESDLQNHYHGSGIEWKKHLEEFGDDVTMKIHGIYSLDVSDKDYVLIPALEFSYKNNIVESKEWANKKLEDGLDGGSIGGELHPCFGTKLSEEHKKAISKANKGKPKSKEHREKLSEATKGEKHHFYGKKRPNQSEKMSGKNNPFYGKTHSEETKEKLRFPKSEETKEKLREANSAKVICPYCEKEGGIRAMKRWHFDNCKMKDRK